MAIWWTFWTFVDKYHAAFRDLATGFGAVVAIRIGFLGLSTWRRQLMGNADHELARGLIIAAYRMRDAIEMVRTPGIHPTEIQAALKERGISLDGLTEGQARRASIMTVYSVRWEPVAKAMRKLRLRLLEAEAVWSDSGAKAAHLAFAGATGKLWAAIIVGDEFREAGLVDPTGDKQRREIMYPADPGNDWYAKELDCAVAGVESIARSHLISR